MNKKFDHPYAVIYPIPEKSARNIFNKKRNIFMKYSPHENITIKLQLCKKVLFYISKSNHQIKGEATIDLIELLDFNEVNSKYGNNIFLSEDEFLKYANGRKNKKMLVFSLTKIYSYPEEVYLDHSITMVGEYITKEGYNKLIDIN